MPKDNCQFCLGEKGGKPGNENVINGDVTICAYCQALLWPHSPKSLLTVSVGVSENQEVFEARALIASDAVYQIIAQGSTIADALLEYSRQIESRYRAALAAPRPAILD
jgi:hypothetical protein